MDNLPAKFGKYTLIRHLATGGMAELYLAIQRSISGFEKLIVIKKILPRFSADEEFIKMFLDEARIAATLNHPNIVQIYDVGSVGKDYFIAMEYIHGEDLRNIVGGMRKKQLKFFPMEHALAIIIGVCKGLSYAHYHRGMSGEPLNIVHRDISPQNILVTFSGEVKIVDFGIARAAARDSVVDGQQGEGALRGKFPYMSPEQIKGLPLDQRSDIFSTGVILFELTTGKRLFKGKNEFETLRKIVDLEYPKPSEFLTDYPHELEEVVMIALQKDRDLRYPDALAMQQDLEEFIRNRRLKVSTIELGKFMEDLFREKIKQEKEALKEGKKLADIIAEKEASEFSFEEFLDLSSLPSSGGTTSRSMAMDASVSAVMAIPQIQKKKRSAVILGMLALLVILLAGAGGFLGYKVWKNSRAEALKIGQVKVRTDPPGAAVYVDGDKVPGETPLTVEKLNPGVRYGISVKLAGYEHVVREVSVTAEQPRMDLDLKLTPVKAAGMAVLKIETNNPEAVFILDGKRLEGKGSLTVDSVKPDVPHSLLVQAPETVDYTQKLLLSPGEIKELNVELKARPLGTDEFVLVLVTDPAGASVSVDGKNLKGVTPGRWRLTWKGSMTMLLSKERFKDRETVIKPVKGKELQVSEKLEKKKAPSGTTGQEEKAPTASGPGFLYLNSEPWANVTIPGVGKFQTPIANLKVPAGTLKITLENPPSGLKKTVTIKVEPGATVRKKVDLKP
jgi:serine/threonine protein kinase